jgi:UDP-N-acetylmuramoyl-tripeptide--D-alanyl-D-alanine ligase
MAVRFSEEQVQQVTEAVRTRVGERASYVAICTDSRRVTPGCLFVALEGERFDAHEFVQQAVDAGAAGLVVKRGRALVLEAASVAVYEVDDTLRALGALARFHRARFKLPVGAVTGSNGKTTTKELIAAILATRGPALKTQGNLNNEVGVPLTLFELEPRHVAAIIEMGMNHEGEIARLAAIAQPDAGLITVVQPAHLAGVGTIEGVARAKGELFRALGPLATAVVNVDDERVAAQAVGVRAKVLTFGRAASAMVRLVGVTAQGPGDGLSLDGSRVPGSSTSRGRAERLVGEHNAMNATGAFALGSGARATPAEECVRGPRGRRRRRRGGCRWSTRRAA